MKKEMVNRLTTIETIEDLRCLLDEVIDRIKSATDDQLSYEVQIRLLLKAMEVGLRIVEFTDLDKRVTALELRNYGITSYQQQNNGNEIINTD